MANKREETPDILGDVLGSDNTSGSSTRTTEAPDDSGEEQGKEKMSDPAEEEGGTDRSNGSNEVPKRKATYYLREDTLSELEEVWFRLRQRADEGEKRRVSKSAVVEAALVEAIDDFNDGGDSTIAQRLLG